MIEIRFKPAPSTADIQLLAELDRAIFDEPMTVETLQQEIDAHTGVICLIAYDDDQPCGYKLGYAQSRKRFYSWSGGVHPSFRKRGVAKALMAQQHELAAKAGYDFVVTHTENRFLDMLIFNLKSGFEIVGTKVKSGPETLTIILEKTLRKASDKS